ncbi:CmpA/NrtA family ABC transporter substrate-binding protein [Crocosphaera sp. XPORK-15E]|uniref:CmpA/NrtA family ABC transporter substrate-binding protein n=1 Tax=Crocosphaera sp. XPORK-15E TaxID=3110247 RepID=UPI002B1F49BA|nr:CmpA/NrtA family ABC transporter substrate-binding protein [Crocosphaera sp. XPORK-15E]MEA5533446.1 CmpA/NrtA family ABC transporter substrate-binding protein [Crocosphaera sp. XPORK-15E]
MMKRRNFLKYTSLGLAGLGFTACSNLDIFSPNNQQKNLDLGSLEKPNLILGFVPTQDAAPLIIAQEKGLFERYGLTVTLKRYDTWEAVEKDLLEWRSDAAQLPYSFPMMAQLGEKQAPLISLMNLNLNGSAIALTQKAWEAGIRPSVDYFNFADFEVGMRNYLRNREKSAKFAVDSKFSMDAYLTRYWLSALGLMPDSEVELVEFPASQMVYKLQAGMIDGDSVSAPWNQQTVLNKAGFITHISRDIWQGHPNKILATMDGWTRKNPTTTKALMAALIEACQYCDRSNNYTEISEILAKPNYLNLDATLIKPTLEGKYSYSSEVSEKYQQTIPDFTIFNHREATYLKDKDNANYPWRSHAVWMLTQMVRWHQLDSSDYPKDADKLLDKIYPVTFYEEVAKGLNIALPSDTMKQEPATAFIDGRAFDPSQPVAYLNQFPIRASRPQFFGFV